MMSPSVRREHAEEAARYAEQNGYVPVTITQALKDRQARALKEGRPSVIRIPFIGNYVPEGYAPTGIEHFVDTSGFGDARSERALTAEQLLDVLVPGKAYALIEAGQFQGYVAEFTPPA